MNQRVAKILKRLAVKAATARPILEGRPARYPDNSWPAIYKALKAAYLAGDKVVKREVSEETSKKEVKDEGASQ